MKFETDLWLLNGNHVASLFDIQLQMSSKGRQVVSDLPDLIGNDGSKASRKDTTDDSGYGRTRCAI